MLDFKVCIVSVNKVAKTPRANPHVPHIFADDITIAIDEYILESSLFLQPVPREVAFPPDTSYFECVHIH